MSIDIYSGILKMFEDFNPPTDNKLRFTYGFADESFDRLKDSYPIANVAGEGTDLSKAVNLLHWVSENIYHKGDYDGHLPNESITLLDYSYGAGRERGISCRSLSTVLTECCLSIGIFARTIHLMPCSPYNGDNHVVTSVYIADLSKWIMLDPTYDCYLVDKTGNILDVFEIRRILSEKGELQYCDKVNYNGDKFDDIREKISEYFAKNLFYFWCRENNTFGSDNGKGGKMIVCSPAGYSVDKAKNINLHYRICQCGDSEDMKVWKAEAGENKTYVSQDIFMSSPTAPLTNHDCMA